MRANWIGPRQQCRSKQANLLPIIFFLLILLFFISSPRSAIPLYVFDMEKRSSNNPKTHYYFSFSPFPLSALEFNLSLLKYE